ncbi:Lig chan domain containing protein [Asbolus verrucosus]|uniref:Lig chan domain containing protein n=1 Tax=Asbolus verrucosus TaxID=1661398 RepID=A0A482W9X9_ASBVE|nr:Lig chan domain containing protein [Asbolus verrucosus]
MMNGTLKIIESPSDKHYFGLQENILNEKIEFSFIPYYHVHILSGIEFSYPRKLENLVVLVPKAGQIPKEEYLFLTFDYMIWIVISIVLVLIAFFLKFAHMVLKKRRKSLKYWILHSWECFIGIGGTAKFNKIESSGRFLLTVWMLTSIIIGAAFQCAFTSTLTQPKYFEDINTLADLRKSGIEILCADYFRDYILNVENYGLRKQLIFVEIDTMIKIRKGRIRNISFMEVYSRAVILAKLYGYHLVKEPIATGYSVYFFQYHSPFADEIHRCVLINEEMGLSKKDDEILAVSEEHDTTSKSTHLTFEHLRSIFFILIFGYHLSFVVFVFEILIKHKK